MFYLWNWQWLLWHSATWLWNAHTTGAQLSQLPVSTPGVSSVCVCMRVPLTECQTYRYHVCLIQYTWMEDSTSTGLSLVFASDLKQLCLSTDTQSFKHLYGCLRFLVLTECRILGADHMPSATWPLVAHQLLSVLKFCQNMSSLHGQCANTVCIQQDKICMILEMS